MMTPSDDSTSRADASSSRFAAMLANAIEPHRPEQRAAAKDKETSELEASNDSESTDDTSATNKTDTADVISAAVAAATSLGKPASGLNPELRGKLARVIERMRSEEGKTVAVAEGVRSQGRQNALFAQGRSAEGPVVTWTRNSLHTKGLAADLTVDGGFTDQGGFDALRRIAEEEGLHTLGKMDPGHVELRSTRNAPAGTMLDSVTTLATKTDSALSTRLPKTDLTAPGNAALRAIATPLAVVPQVARVARVATVATVAGVAAAGASGQANSARTSSSGTSDQRSDTNSGGEKRAATPVIPESTAVDSAVGGRAYNAFSRPTTGGSGADVRQISGPDASQSALNVDRVQDMQDSHGAKTLSRLNLSVDDGRGGEDVVRIGMRGNTVGASFDMRDAGNADRISARLSDLTRALERRGLEPQTFNVRSTASAHDGAAPVRVGLASSTVGTDTTTRQQDQAGARDEGRHSFARHQEQQERARDRSDDRRRRDGIFSLTQEDA